MVSATHIYKTYAKHTTPFSFQLSLFSLTTMAAQSDSHLLLRDALDFALGVVEGDDLLAVGRHIEHNIHHYCLADGA